MTGLNWTKNKRRDLGVSTSVENGLVGKMIGEIDHKPSKRYQTKREEYAELLLEAERMSKRRNSPNG